MKDWIKENWSKLSIIAGVFLAVQNILDFSHVYTVGPRPPGDPGDVIYHYYEHTITMIAIGSALIAIGYLYNSRNE